MEGLLTSSKTVTVCTGDDAFKTTAYENVQKYSTFHFIS